MEDASQEYAVPLHGSLHDVKVNAARQRLALLVGQLVCNVERQHVATRRELGDDDLTELDDLRGIGTTKVNGLSGLTENDFVAPADDEF